MIRDRVRRLEALVGRLAAVLRGDAAPPAQPMKTIHDVIELLNEQVQAVRADRAAGALEKARLLGYLCSTAARVIKTGDLDDRVKLLEAILKVRDAKP
jgi:hypothetical protein